MTETVAAAPTPKGNIEAEKKPVLRHEFVGMMFAVTIAEVGLQVAAVVKRGEPIHFLPAYIHLALATIIVAASWVGWSLSPSYGAQEDVVHVLHPGFLVLLTDVFLVIVYFILVRSVDFSDDRKPYIASIPRIARLIVTIFVAYFWWDVITKLPLLYKKKIDWDWARLYGTRAFVTFVCLGLALWVKHCLGDPNQVHYLPADFVLLCLILLFRALKDVCSVLFPTTKVTADSLSVRKRKRRAVGLAVFCLAAMLLGLFWAQSREPLPAGIAQEIQKEPPADK